MTINWLMGKVTFLGILLGVFLIPATKSCQLKKLDDSPHTSPPYGICLTKYYKQMITKLFYIK